VSRDAANAVCWNVRPLPFVGQAFQPDAILRNEVAANSVSLERLTYGEEFAVSQDAPLRIDAKELFSAKVEDYLEVQSALQRVAEEVEPQSWIVRVIYSSWFYLSLCAGLGAFCGWAILEPFF